MRACGPERGGAARAARNIASLRQRFEIGCSFSEFVEAIGCETGVPVEQRCRISRFAYYAGADSLLLPTDAVHDICAWLRTQNDPGYIVLDNHDERRAGITTPPQCLSFLKRYPRYGTAYYDLFEVRRSK